MWVVCHRAAVANCRRGVLQSCMSEKTEDPFEPFWPAFLRWLSLKHPEGASEEARSRTAGPIRSHSHLNVCSLDDPRNMEICTPCPGLLTRRLTRISKPMEKAGEKEEEKKKKKRKKIRGEKTSLRKWQAAGIPTAVLGLTRVASTSLESSKSIQDPGPRYLFVTCFHYHTVCIYQIFR